MRLFLIQLAVLAVGLLLSLWGAAAAARASGTVTGMECAQQGIDGSCREVRSVNGLVGVPVFVGGLTVTIVGMRWTDRISARRHGGQP